MCASHVQPVLREVGSLHQRLFNHSAAIQGEIHYFLTHVEEYRAHDFDSLLQTLQAVNEAKELDIEKPLAHVFAGDEGHKLVSKLDTVTSTLQRIVERGEKAEKERAYVQKEVAKQREEWDQFTGDIAQKRKQVDLEFESKIEELKTHFDKMKDKYKLQN